MNIKKLFKKNFLLNTYFFILVFVFSLIIFSSNATAEDEFTLTCGIGVTNQGGGNVDIDWSASVSPRTMAYDDVVGFLSLRYPDNTSEILNTANGDGDASGGASLNNLPEGNYTVTIDVTAYMGVPSHADHSNATTVTCANAPSSNTRDFVVTTGGPTPVDGGWSNCSVACDGGTRSCNNPPPSNGGAACVGSTSCNPEPCFTPTDGVCALTHYGCAEGNSANNVSGGTTWTWNCNGVAGGSNASCSENKPSGGGSPTGNISATPCTIADGASTCTSVVNWGTANLTANPTEVTRNNPNGTHVSFSDFGTDELNLVNFGASTFFLYHNSVLLDSVAINASCAGGTTWNGNLCEGAIPPPTNLQSSCLGAATTANYSWDLPPGYSLSYFRIQDRADGIPIRSEWIPIEAGHGEPDVGPATTTATTPGHTYDWWVHTRSASGTFSVPVYGAVTCTPTAACNGGVDVGLRIYQNGARVVAVEAGAPTSKLKVYKNGIRGVVLVDPTDPNASKMKIQTPSGVKALCLL